MTSRQVALSKQEAHTLHAPFSPRNEDLQEGFRRGCTELDDLIPNVIYELDCGIPLMFPPFLNSLEPVIYRSYTISISCKKADFCAVDLEIFKYEDIQYLYIESQKAILCLNHLHSEQLQG